MVWSLNRLVFWNLIFEMSISQIRNLQNVGSQSLICETQFLTMRCYIVLTWKETRMCSAKFVSAQLQDALMMDVDLTNADMRKADLTGTNLRSAIMTGVNIKGVALDSCYLYGTELEHLCQVDRGSFKFNFGHTALGVLAGDRRYI